jgi:hypothetical protein
VLADVPPQPIEIIPLEPKAVLRSRGVKATLRDILRLGRGDAQ